MIVSLFPVNAIWVNSYGRISGPLPHHRCGLPSHPRGSFREHPERLAQPAAPCQHRWRAIGTPPRLPALCVENHAGERLWSGNVSPRQHWPRAPHQILFAILHFPSDPFRFEGKIILRCGHSCLLPSAHPSMLPASRMNQ